MQMFSKFASTTKQATLAAVLCLGLATHAGATPTGVAAVSFPSTGLADPAAFPGAGTIGWSFSLAGSQTLTYLGLYNTDLNQPTTVGLWNSSGTLLSSATFDVSNPLVDQDDIANSGFLWLQVSSLNLGAGQYTIGAFAPADPNLGSRFGVYGVTASNVSGLNIVKSSLVSFASSIDKPTNDFSGVYASGFFGPNLRFADSAPIPVPAAFWLLGSGLVGLFGISKRKRTV